jgi:quercetin dioxygenase-like cupin family protein
MERSIEQATSSITFTRSPNGRFSDWHNAPRRQYAIFLSGGQMEVVIGDGTTRRFGPGDAVLFEDLTGHGHTSRSVGGDRLTAIVPLAD